ncbi:MAG TPA: enoyl-CoA hydratase/isomerase family protein [Ktedonobacterales bacterium]|jgi:enoyl-CoA hydratase|nr:enoyl-CoA hydratase/isomerase family protein [Ktedonobacterales bacterium]
MSVTDLQLQYTTVEMDGNVCVFRLNRPPANAHNFDMVRELERLVTEIRYDSNVKAVMMASANPRFFSAGADIEEIKEKSAEYIGLLSQTSKEMMMKMRATPKVYVAAVNGHCMGGGLELALACDVRFAGRGTWKVGLPEVSLGLIPGEGGTQFAGRVMGPSRALLYMVTGEAFGPEKATELGLFDELVEPDQVEARALEFAHKCADGPNKAIGFMKLALTEGLELPIYEAFAYERHLQNQLFDTPDSKEGVAAFVEKRQPRWGQGQK